MRMRGKLLTLVMLCILSNAYAQTPTPNLGPATTNPTTNTTTGATMTNPYGLVNPDTGLMYSEEELNQKAIECQAGRESGGALAAGQPAICNEWGFCGYNQMAVSTMVQFGYCQPISPSSITYQGQACPHSTYWACNKWRNIKLGIYKHQNHWNECVWTQKAIDAAALDPSAPPLQHIVDSTNYGFLNMQQFATNAAFQYDVYMDHFNSTLQTANELYQEYFGNGQSNVINGVPMDPYIIQYLINAAGVGGAEAYISSMGLNAAVDEAYGFDITVAAAHTYECITGIKVCA